MKNQLSNFYLKNYKLIHHVINIPLFFTIMYLTGLTEFVTDVSMQIFGLLICYFVTKFILNITENI
jgi:hypothetical protein